MRAYGFIVLFCLSLFGAPPARAADVFDRLQNEPVTMFDFGIKRLRTIVLQAARKIVLSSDPVPQSSVAFDSEKREIRIGYIIRSSAPVLGMATCQERRALAIKEVFNVGLTAYSGQVSEQQRVILRLGRMFTREPAENRDSVLAKGERLADSTDFKISMSGKDGGPPVICGGRLSETPPR